MRSYSFYKWRIWMILALSFVMSLFHRSAMGVISPSIATDFDASASVVGSVASITFYTYAFMQIPAGLLLDYYGYKKISFLGVLITGIGSILLGMAPHISLIFIGRFLVGLGSSVIFISILKSQTIWFSKNDFTKASGLLSFIGNIGGMLATFPLAILVGIIGWRYSMVSMGVLCVGIAFLIFLFVKDTPDSYGYEAQGTMPKKEKVNLKAGFKSLLINKALWRNFFVLFTLVGCTTTLTGVWGINYLQTVYHMTSTRASFLISFIMFGMILGSLFINTIAHYFSNNIAMIPRLASTGMALCWFYFLVIANGKPSMFMLMIIFLIMGFLAMAHIISFTDILQHCEPRFGGLATSIVNSGEFIGSSIISMVIGFILDATANPNLITATSKYTPDQFKICFTIFMLMSLIGIATSFIGSKPTEPTLYNTKETTA